MSNVHELNGNNLTIDAIVDIARNNAKVKISDESKEKIIKCRKFLESKIDSKEVMYGVNTGIGEFSEIVLNDEQLELFQKNLIYNHSAGIGDPAPIEYVRGALAGRINVHSNGHSGCRLEITQTIVDMLNKGVTPFVCQKGSVGASGDLAPMAQAALLMLGEGQAYYQGELLPGKVAFERAGIPIPGLKARDGLAFINGSNLLTAMSAIHLYDFKKLIKHAEIAAAMSLEALMANMKPYSKKLHEVRGFQGAVKSAISIRKCLEGSDLITGKIKTKVQDAYSMRSSPQVIGTARDSIRWAQEQVEIELNGVGDNPIFFPDDNEVLSGANFQGSPVSLPMDSAGAAITMVSVLSERRLNRLLNPALSQGLPSFLTDKAGLYSGLMLSQYTADTLIVEQRILSTPASVQSIPAAADQEDFVSMGMNTALKNKQILENAQSVIGIEFFAAAQALDFRDFNYGQGVTKAYQVIRKYIEYLDEDRPLYNDHNTITELVRSNEILESVESVIGDLDIE
ncbi:MAG: aromatic amino acid lyase [Ignavibacteriae bacterium]|nr:aromatic amino acid lyase [Ignavibacteriota bacterium]MCB9220828.1 aromatic amino acid lyase [Ignavibacteria bacterium]